jgi:predicted permease
LILLVSACLLTQSLWKLTQSPLGFQPNHVLTFETSLWVLNGDTAPVDRFYNEVQGRLEALPGVTAVGQISALPTVNWHLRSNYDVDWAPRTMTHDAVSAENRHIAGNYLESMQIPLLAGRALRPEDGNNVLVNQEFARQYYPSGNPIGMHLMDDHTMTIVGVIGNVRGTAGSIADPVQPEVYLPAAGLGQRYFAIRSQLPAQRLLPLVVNVVHQVDPQQAMGKAQTLDDMLSIDTAQPRLNMVLLISFAVIALALACVGIYGVVAYSVAQRRQEIGVHMALGASHSQITSLFLKRTLTSALIGLACGGVATLLLTRLLRSQLYGVQPNDPMTFLIATLLLLAPVFAASLRPALKAASVDPMEALRTE